MNSKKILLGLLTLLVITGISVVVLPAHAATYPVLLDANSSSATDAGPDATNSVVKTFNVGAIVEANSTTPLNGVFGWQFSIIYDNTTVIPQGDPGAGLASDASTPTATFGAQSVTGLTGGWAAQITAAHAFGSSVLVPVDKTHKEIEVFYTFLAPNFPAGVNLGPTASATVKGVILGSVAFELIKPGTALSFSLHSGNTQVVDPSARPIAGVISGGPVSVTITNTPPVASFTATHIPTGDSSCTPVTGVVCSAFAERLDGSASSDSDGFVCAPVACTSGNAQGYFWDFGDATQDNLNSVATCTLLNCNQGSIAIHDFGATGPFNVTVRIVDNQGATGSSRDSLGNLIVNNQPSHMFLTVSFVVPPTVDPTSTVVTCVPSPVSLGVASTCTATVTDTATTPTAPTGAVGFTTSDTGNFITSPCVLATPTSSSASCSVTYTPTATGSGTHTITASYLGDSSHATSSGSFNLGIATAHSTTTNIGCDAAIVINQASTCTATVTDTSVTGPTAPTGMVLFTQATLAAGSFSSNPCTLAASGTVGTATCTANFSSTTVGSASVTAAYTSSDTTAHRSSSTAAPFIILVGRRSVSVTVSCASPVTVDTASSCNVTVADTSPGTPITPTGTVSFVSNSTGTFSGTSNSCTLSGAGSSSACTLTYTPSVTGHHHIVANYPGDTNHIAVSNSFDITVSTASLAGAHASLSRWSADAQLHHESLSKNPTNTFRAFGINDGNRTVWVYVRFHIATVTGSSQDVYTQVVQLSPGQSINGKTDNRFSATFTPPGTGSFTVTATIFFSASPSPPPIGDTSFQADLLSQKTFSFTVVP